MKSIQRLGLALYSILSKAGFFSSPTGRKFFLLAYNYYKRFIEAGPVDGLRRFVSTHSVVIDVGANVGFFTLKFADWVGPEGSVIAIEPDLKNYTALQRALSRTRNEARVQVINAAVADKSGVLLFELNEVHPGDHKISVSQNGIEVPAITLDSLVGQISPRRVSLVKIDVQGAESLVLNGAGDILRVHRPALYVEVDEAALAHFGSSSEKLVAGLETQGYRMFELLPDGTASRIGRMELQKRLSTRGYFDVLFLPRSGDDRGNKGQGGP